MACAEYMWSSCEPEIGKKFIISLIKIKIKNKKKKRHTRMKRGGNGIRLAFYFYYISCNHLHAKPDRQPACSIFLNLVVISQSVSQKSKLFRNYFRMRITILLMLNYHHHMIKILSLHDFNKINLTPIFFKINIYLFIVN